MINTFLKISLRTLRRHKLYTAINILSLSLGLAACIVIYLVATYEFGFDSFHPGKENIYRVVSVKSNETGEGRPQAGAPAPLASGARTGIPGIETITAYYPWQATIKVASASGNSPQFNNKAAYGSGNSTIITGADYFRVMHYEWLAGNAATAMQSPYKVVLTEASAKKFFGNIPASTLIGRQLIFNDSLPLQVSGIVKDWPGQTDFPFTEFITATTVPGSFLRSEVQPQQWGNGDNQAWQTLIRLAPQTNPSKVAGMMSSLSVRNMQLEKDQRFRVFLQPLSAIHFDAGIDDQVRKASKPVLYSLIGVALFILLLAVVNFINLSTAQFAGRAKETGIRKIMGSSKKGLMLQFLSESFLLTLCAILLVMLLLTPLLALLHDFLPQGLSFRPDAGNFLFLLLLVLMTALLAGLYPAKLLSSYSPVLMLKGGVTTGGTSKDRLRKVLIVFQFAVSLVFIMCAMMVGKQLEYMLTRDFGFNAQGVMKLDTDPGDVNKRAFFLNKALGLPGVKDVSMQSFPPMGDMSAMVPLQYKGATEITMPVKLQAADEHFIPLYEIQLLAGRNIRHSDSLSELVINRSFAAALGFENPLDIVGKQLFLGERGYPVVGVVADFHQSSYREPIAPEVILHLPVAETGLAVKLAADDKNSTGYYETLSKLEKLWKTVYPGVTFSPQFLSESIARLYEQERKTSWLVRFAMITAIIISCIGLLGLSVFMAEKRTKEIGIRKVLGASVVQITRMLCRDYLVLVAVAIVIASPIATYLIHRWLEGFAYRVDISAWLFFAGGLGAMAIALLTVLFQSIKAAFANPVNSLRNE